MSIRYCAAQSIQKTGAVGEEQIPTQQRGVWCPTKNRQAPRTTSFLTAPEDCPNTNNGATGGSGSGLSEAIAVCSSYKNQYHSFMKNSLTTHRERIETMWRLANCLSQHEIQSPCSHYTHIKIWSKTSCPNFPYSSASQLLL